jgi:excisionase family DNA binding protein
MVAPADNRNWLTPDEAAQELGCAAPTVRKRMAEYGGYRVGRRIRFDRATVLASRRQPDFLHAPNATIQELSRALELQAALSRQQQLEIEQLKREVRALREGTK